MKKFLASLITTVSLSTFAQELLPTKIINERTGESIGIECLEKNEDGCSLFQYWVADSVDSQYHLISGPVGVSQIETMLKEKREKKPNSRNIFESDRLLLLSETSEIGISYFDRNEYTGEVGGEMVQVVKQMYKRGKYQSNAAYALQVVGATSFAVFPLAFAAPITAGLLAADIAFLPVRVVGKMIRGNKVVTGKDRRNLKEALKIQEEALTGDENIVLKTNVWKKVLDGVNDL